MQFFMVCLVGLLVSVRASLASSPVVSGQVRLPDGSPVAGAQVVLFDVADLRRGPVGQATTDEAGTFALPLTAANGALARPSEVGLGQNYPNPFNPSTLIPYQLATPAPVRLEVFNVLGQRVATLVDGQQAAGAYVARWDGTDALGRAAASGVYFYRLTVAGAHWTGKMVLVDGQAGVPLGGARVTMVSMADGSTAAYGLVVSAAGRVAHVDSDFGGGVKPVVIELAAEPNRRGKVVASLEGLLGDVNADERVDLDDGLLVAMYSVDPALLFPHHGLMTLGDVNCDGRVELEDAGLLATYVANPSDAAVSSLRMGQPGGYSLDPVTEVVWGSILGNEQSDATVAQILDEVPVRLSGVLPDDDGEDRLYLGIDRAYWTEQGGKQLYEALKQRFPATPIHVEPSIGVIRHSGKVVRLPTTTALRQVTPVTRFGPPMSFTESPNAALPDHSKAQQVVGSITVPDAGTVGSVAVAVDITHPSRGDLKVDLVAPSGAVVNLFDGVRGGINPADNLVGALPISTELQGQAAQGTWQLRVGDYEPGDTGTLNAWSLTVTPAEETLATEEPVNLLLETFQDGLGAWQTTAWEAASLASDAAVPGEGPGNIVAKAEGCSICFLNLSSPVDLSAYDSVTLSFYRWLDPGMGDFEFLGVEIGNNGSYQRLDNWGKEHADGQWHLETFTLSGDQISDAFTLRFFGIATNAFTTVAVDNVMITATPGSVVVTPEVVPDLAVTSVTVSPSPAVPGASLSLQTTVENTGAPTGVRSVRLYRYQEPTATPQDGTPVTATSTALQTDATKTVQARTDAPTEPGTYYFYACVSALEQEADTANNCAATTVVVQETETTERPDLTIRFNASPPASVGPSTLIIFFARVSNVGFADAGNTTIRLFRHTQRTETPRTGGVQAAITSLSPAPGAGASGIKQLKSRAPTTPGTYYFYLCVDQTEGEVNTTNNCTSRPMQVTVQGDQETPAAAFSVTNLTATPPSVQSTFSLTIAATITNTSSGTATSTPITIYRHTQQTATPKTGGVKEPNTAATGTLAPNASVTVTSTHEAPTVTRTTRYYYYLCVGDTCASNPAEAVVRVKPAERDPALTGCHNAPEQNTPMGGDSHYTQLIGDSAARVCTSITLGGVEDTDGIRGFIVSGHGVVQRSQREDGTWADDYSITDTVIGHSKDRQWNIKYFLGKVYRMPPFQTAIVDDYGVDTRGRLIAADAAFVAYPYPTKPGCSLTWDSDNESFCLDHNGGEQLERLAPLAVRGANGSVHTVTGSQAVTEGLELQTLGAASAVPVRSVAKGNKLLFREEDVEGRYYEYANYASLATSEDTIGGDSGAPVYTVPDADGNVRMVGVLIGGTYDHKEYSTLFTPWEAVEDSFNLLPLGAPAPASPPEENEEDLADLFSLFD